MPGALALRRPRWSFVCATGCRTRPTLIGPIVQKRIFFTLFVSHLTPFLQLNRAQDGSPSFAAPLDIPLSLSGNFMELRNDHFHSGLDLRTESREGLPVRAAEDGWVSRIKVSPWGYGKALYIEHPNGHTTVYGHLRNYTGAIAEAVLNAQYKARSFEVDVNFSANELPVKRGQLVANSGNSGGSSGPHLHFEVRRTRDQHALDPEQYGLNVPDDVPPTFIGLRIDPLDSAARVQPYPGKARGIVLSGKDGAYTIKGDLAPKGLGNVGISVNVIDRYSNSGSTCGIRSLKVTIDDVPLFSAMLDEVDFDKQRYANAYMDHALFKGNDMNYNRCYRLPGNKLDLYGHEPDQGRILLKPGQLRRVLVEAIDANGNRSVFPFTLAGATEDEARTWNNDTLSGTVFRYDQENSLSTADFRFTLPANSLYVDERINAATTASAAGFAALVRIHTPMCPLHVAGQLSLRVTTPPARPDKLLLVKVDDKGKASPVGGTYADGWVSHKVRTFGTYTVMLDTVPPKVTLLDLKPDMSGRDSLRIQVTDDLSGVGTCTATLDGNWILLDYDPKRKMLTHAFDKHSNKKGKHTLRLTVADERGNSAEVSGEFTR